MFFEGIIFDYVVFIVILIVCSRVGLVEEGYCLFDMMRNKYFIVFLFDYYVCMVDFLGRFGYLKAVYGLLKLMFVEFYVGVWGLFFGSCRLYCDFELVEVVVNRLVEFESSNVGNFVLLFNIYAVVDRWLDVFILRN